MQSKKCCCCCCEHNTLQRTAHLLLCLSFFFFFYLLLLLLWLIIWDIPLLFVQRVFLQPCYFMSRSLVEEKVCRVTPDCAVASGLAESALAFFACAAVCEGLQAGGFKPPLSANCKAYKKTSPACTRDIGTVERHALCQKHNNNWKSAR